MRILYDAGQSITGGEDPRLGTVHVVLLSHAHGDHIGDQKLKALEAARAPTRTSSRRCRSPPPRRWSPRRMPRSSWCPRWPTSSRRRCGIALRRAGRLPADGQRSRGPVRRTLPCDGAPRRHADREGRATREGRRDHPRHGGARQHRAARAAHRGCAQGARARRRQLCARAAGRLRAALHERPRGLPVGRHRHARRDEDGRRRLLQGQPGRSSTSARARLRRRTPPT